LESWNEASVWIQKTDWRSKNNNKKKQEGNVHVKVTMRNLNLTTVDVVKQ